MALDTGELVSLTVKIGQIAARLAAATAADSPSGRIVTRGEVLAIVADAGRLITELAEAVAD